MLLYSQVQETKEKFAKEKEERRINKKSRRGADRSHKFKMDVSEAGGEQQGEEGMEHAPVAAGGATWH